MADFVSSLFDGKRLGDKPMTAVERQAPHRAARAAARPVIHYRRAADHRSRIRRWHDAGTVLLVNGGAKPGQCGDVRTGHWMAV